jgi:type IV secretion system protein VirD4
MWDGIAGIAARGGLGVAQPWPATAEDRLPSRGWPSATRSVQQGGITLQLLYQSVGQLERHWGREGKREWYDGVSHRSYAAVQDIETARELEETFGTYAVMATSEGSNTGASGKALETGSRSRGANTSYHEISRPLIRREELMNDCRTDEAFVVIRGAKPLRCGRAIFFRRPELEAKIAENRFSQSISAAD